MSKENAKNESGVWSREFGVGTLFFGNTLTLIWLRLIVPFPGQDNGEFTIHSSQLTANS